MLDPSTALAIAWKTSLVLGAIGLIACLTARQSAAWRHFLWTCALALSLLMPIAIVSLPSFVQVTLPWKTVEPWARDTTALVTTDEHASDAAPEVRSARANEQAVAARLIDVEGQQHADGAGVGLHTKSVLGVPHELAHGDSQRSCC